MPGLICFKAYDIRGRVGVDLDAALAQQIGRAFGQMLGARTVVLGRDARSSSPDLAAAVARGLMAAGADVVDLGLCGTEQVYAATTDAGADGGVMVTASHNPVGDNGMKFVAAGSAPLEPGRDVATLRQIVEGGEFHVPGRTGVLRPDPTLTTKYVNRVMGFLGAGGQRPLTILVNAGHGAAGPTFDLLATALAARGVPWRFHRVFHDPDPTFPQGIPNPQLVQNHPATARAIVASGADFGVAWDGDFDRCFLFDATGAFVPGEYVVGLLAQAFLQRDPGAAIVHDPRVIWNTQDVVAQGGGRAVQSPTGHSHLKRVMRDTGAVYGGEMSAHHYFRDFMACDSGMIPWLLVADLISQQRVSLADLVASRRAAFPSSGEINFTVHDPAACIARVARSLAPLAHHVDRTDGLSLSFGNWRANLRASNTEPLLRLNVEARGDTALVVAGVARIRGLIETGMT